MIEIRPMTTGDVSLGMRLKDQAGWNQTPADWRRFLELEPQGCFVAELEGLPVGTTTTCILGDVGWIAMVLVDEPARHRGVATRLVQHAIRYLRRQGVPTVRLDATPLGRPVYERLGFVAEYELDRLAGQASAAEAPSSPVVAVGREDVDCLAVLDQRASGTQRRRLLDRLWRENPGNCGKVVRDSAVEGYVMLREGSRAAFIGPAVATAPAAGCALLDWAVHRCAGRPVFVDIPCDNAEAIGWASSRGLRAQRRFTRMCLGPPVRERRDQLWASSGPEKG